MPELDWQSWLTLWVFTPLFVMIAWTDFTQMRIPNLYCLLGGAVVLMTAPFPDWNQLLLRLLVAAACFAICFGLFAAGWLGGGDAKILPIVFAAIPVPVVSTYLLILAGCMAAGLIGMSLFRRLARQTSPHIKSTAQSREFPLGIAIGSSGVILAIWSATALWF